MNELAEALLPRKSSLVGGAGQSRVMSLTTSLFFRCEHPERSGRCRCACRLRQVQGGVHPVPLQVTAMLCLRTDVINGNHVAARGGTKSTAAKISALQNVLPFDAQTLWHYTDQAVPGGCDITDTSFTSVCTWNGKCILNWINFQI